MSNVDTFKSKSTLTVGDKDYEIYRLDKVKGSEKLPFSLKVLLENLLRTEDGANITSEHIEALGSWDPSAEPDTEIQFTPARVVMQDFTGVPCIVDLATMREKVVELGGSPDQVNPLAPAELVIDHSVQIDRFGTADAVELNMDIEYQRNGERYQFLRWGQTAFDDFKVVPPGTGIVHQVNIEHLARVVMPREVDGVLRAYPDTVFGTDSHTTMINGLGVLGWGVGGIEAEAAMLGQPISMLIPRVVGFKLSGEIQPGVTATDVVLTITDMLRQHGVVGKFVEFYGAGVAAVPLANRATIGNMSPEFGSTCAIFPIDDVTIDYLKLTGRSAGSRSSSRRGLPRPRVCGTIRARKSSTPSTSNSTCPPWCPRSPDRSARRTASNSPMPRTSSPRTSTTTPLPAKRAKSVDVPPPVTDATSELANGAVAIASITSCTNTSNPSVMAAGLLARNARKRGLNSKPWVKTSIAPGSKVVTDATTKAGLIDDLEA